MLVLSVRFSTEYVSFISATCSSSASVQRSKIYGLLSVASRKALVYLVYWLLIPLPVLVLLISETLFMEVDLT